MLLGLVGCKSDRRKEVDKEVDKVLSDMDKEADKEVKRIKGIRPGVNF